MLKRIKIRICPDSRQLCITNTIGVAGILDVYRIT